MAATTINMHLDTLTSISRAAIKLKTSKRDIIVRLLMRIMREIDGFKAGFSSVRYQANDPEGRWHCFSINFKIDESEFFSDLRNFCKCSVSLLVAIAVEKYLGEMIEELKEGLHNYFRFSNYIIHREMIDGIVCWRLYWGSPMDHLRTLLL
jgi:hypothetical protein